MTPAEQSSLHVVLLQSLRAKGDLGRAEEALLNDVRLIGGYDVTLAALQVELRALANQKKWIAEMEAELGPKRWLITPLGKTQLAIAGL